jgi:hypothetical protein
MLIFALSACQHDVETVFPAGLEPLADATAAWPTGTDAAPYPEEVSVDSGDDDAFAWATARGYVDRPLADVFTAVQDPDVGVDRRRVTSWTTDSGVEPEYEVSFVVHTHVEDIVNVDYDLTWREGHTDDETGTIAVRWAKTDGSSLVSLLEGSIVLTPVEDEVTGLEFVEHLDAATQGPDVVATYLGDFYASVLAEAHGDPLPEFSAQ